jgi:hypothetical protein
MKPHCYVAEGPAWHSPRSGLVQQDGRANSRIAVQRTVLLDGWRRGHSRLSLTLALDSVRFQ